MTKRPSSFDWNQARSFLAAADQGSLSAAARLLNLTQPTVSRQIAALEEELGVTLFDRVGRSISLTPSGMELCDHVRAMDEAANLVSLTASGQSEHVAGRVCITASDTLATYHLPAILKQLREIAPQVEVDIVASNTLQDLHRRQADIAIRHSQPEHQELVAQLVNTTQAHLYASTNYLDQFGRPESISDLTNFDFISFDDPDTFIHHLNRWGLALSRQNVRFSSSNGVVCWELTKQGLGLCAMLKELAIETPGIEVVLPEEFAIDVPVWVMTHKELYASRRIRVVFDFLFEALSAKQP